MEAKQTYLQDMTERYIYEVTRRLPASQRKDIEKELGTLIEDMLSERTDTPAPEDIDAVLTELGRPAALAEKYNGKKACLIGPAYYNLYIMLLKIVLPATALGICIAMIVGMLTQAPDSLGDAIGSFMGALFSAPLQAFAYITIGFALAERYAKDGKFPKEQPWRPADLPPKPEKGMLIPKSEPIAGMIFTVLAIILFNAAPGLFSIYSVGETTVITPVFELSALQTLLPLLNIIFCMGLLRELLKLVIGRYTLQLAIPSILLHAVSLGLTFWFLSHTEIWNPQLPEALQNLGFPITADDLAGYVRIFVRIILALSVVGFLSESITLLVKAFKYGK